MAEWTFNLVLLTHAALILVLLVNTLRARKVVDQLIAFDALSVVSIAVLAVIGIHRQESPYLDIALVVAILAFVQTVAVVRLLERGVSLK